MTGVGPRHHADGRPQHGCHQSETAWTEPFGCNPPAAAPTDVNCSGGGFSSVYARPGYQSALQKNHAQASRMSPTTQASLAAF